MSRPPKGVGAGPRALSVLYLDRVLVSFVHGSVFGTITSPCKFYRIHRFLPPEGVQNQRFLPVRPRAGGSWGRRRIRAQDPRLHYKHKKSWEIYSGWGRATIPYVGLSKLYPTRERQWLRVL